MNQLLLRSNPKLCHQGHFSFVLRSRFFSTDTITTPNDPLFHRITMVADPKVSVITVIQKWLQEGQRVMRPDLNQSIKQLCKYNSFSHALEISEWMRQRGYGQTVGDTVVQLDLISKVHGLDEAEKYCYSLPDHHRTHLYGTLLNCYVDRTHLEKAEAIMQTMKELGLAKPVSYNLMLSLYSKMGQYEDVDILMQEMEDQGIWCNKYAFKILVKAYAVSSNIEKMEKLLMKMERDPRINWKVCVAAAKGYLKAGFTEKALTMLKRSEQLIKGNEGSYAYKNLLSLYADTGNKDELYRLWNFYKNKAGFDNSGYSHMISLLMKSDEYDSAEEVWEEWLSVKTLFEVHIPNAVITGYSKKGLWEKAEAFVKKIVDSGMELNADSFDHLASGYRVGGQMVKAAEAIKKAISISKPGWKPNTKALAACLKGLKGQGDVEAAEELFNTIHFDQMEGYDQILNGETPEIVDIGEEVSAEE
ncbi:unnamed protein product [Dovyalis caffra]|uniref:Pentatricopeptide repeat-containing protein n=1 Tax=Dovyalis caffra TaxID=77055 RepID=A0AAV1SFH4_9ROSI|nr:unnamed protein product [Dovyalis caffra]